MGLDICINTGISFRLGGYSALHTIRTLAVYLADQNRFKNYEDANKELKKVYKDEELMEQHKFAALIDFSDCEGIYKPSHWTLEQVIEYCEGSEQESDSKNSLIKWFQDNPFYLGDSGKLFDNLSEMTRLINKFDTVEIEVKQAIEMFKTQYGIRIEYGHTNCFLCKSKHDTGYFVCSDCLSNFETMKMTKIDIDDSFEVALDRLKVYYENCNQAYDDEGYLVIEYH